MIFTTTRAAKRLALLLAATAGAPTPASATTICVHQPSVCDGSYSGTDLSLSGQLTGGTLPTEIGLLTQLTRISLQRNYLSGSVHALSGSGRALSGSGRVLCGSCAL